MLPKVTSFQKFFAFVLLSQKIGLKTPLSVDSACEQDGFRAFFGAMNKYKDNPEVALTTLQKIAEEIPSGVSASDVGDIIVQIKGSADETAEHINDTISTKLRKTLETFWIDYSVCEKLENVKRLKQCAFANVARPPLSPNAKMNAIQANVLKIRREALEAKLRKIRAENSELQDHLIKEKELINKQLEDIRLCELSL